MIPAHIVNQAYDTLNLPRDAVMQEARDRFKVLTERYTSTQDTEKLESVQAAFRLIEKADASLRSQREMISNQTRSRSERELDGRLTEMALKAAESWKRMAPPPEAVEKKQKLEENPEVSEVKLEANDGVSSSKDDCTVFEKLNSLLKDETKYLRAVNVLFNMVKTILDGKDFIPYKLRLLSESIDIAASAVSSGDADACLSNLNDDNRKAITKVVNLILTSDDLRTRISIENPENVRIWSHSIIFRNSLFELDNFRFVKKCKELVQMVSSASVPPQSHHEERWIGELLLTIQTLCSRSVCKAIPGRWNDTKSTMTEIFKISRKSVFPQNFREKVAELQKKIMAY